MVTITFNVNGSAVTIHANEGDNLLQAAQRANVAIDAPCSGNGACGKCKVRLVSGELDSPPDPAHIRGGVRPGLAAELREQGRY